MEFNQNSDQELTLTLTEAEQRRELRGDSFWHLYMQEPESVCKRLVPVLEILHPSWHLASLGESLEEALFESVLHARPSDAQRWNNLVNGLASQKFADRVNAERELRAAGQVILPFLQNLDRDRLDAEQLSRIRALVDSLSDSYEDSIDRIAIWLAGDQQIWLSLLTRDELPKRRLAATQLAALLGSPVDFDPAADESKRREQIERLRARLQVGTTAPTAPN